MKIRPITLREANAFVKRYHRHSAPTRGCRFALSMVDASGNIRGVAICGRPVARRLDAPHVLEVLRVCTDGTGNLNSRLYAACKRVSQAMGYDSLITYTLRSESGASLRAVGAERWDGKVRAKRWNWSGRPRATQTVEQEAKYRWELMVEKKDLSSELWREYDFGGRVYRIEEPTVLYVRPGGTTHRIVDAAGVTHCVPAPGQGGCVLRWQSKNASNPVSF